MTVGDSKYYANTIFEKIVFRTDDINNNTTCAKIDRANTNGK